MGREELLAKLHDMLPDLSRRYGVEHLWMFGSRARDDFRPTSDLDLLVEFRDASMSLYDFAELELELEDRVGLPVQLVERDALRPELQPHVLAEAVRV